MPEKRDEAVHRVLRLVAEGRLTADEAAPILDALAKATEAVASGQRAAASGTAVSGSASERSSGDRGGDPQDRPRYARIQVMEGGRRSVDLRVPVGLGRFALSKVPGLSSDQIDEVQDALASGTHGPILDIQDADGDGVRIVLE
jgi:hypothetical protein